MKKKKTTLVFSLVKDQSIFMTVIISILSFLAIVSLGIALSIGSGVVRWNTQWDKYATIQISNSDNTAYIKQVFTKHSKKIESVKEITKTDMENMMRPWISGGARLTNYLPEMYELKMKNAKAIFENRHVNALCKILEPYICIEKFYFNELEINQYYCICITYNIIFHWRMYFIYIKKYCDVTQTRTRNFKSSWGI